MIYFLLLIIVTLLLLLSDKKLSYKKLQEDYWKKQDKINTLNKEVRMLVIGTELEKEAIQSKYKLMYEQEGQAWYGRSYPIGTSTYTGIFNIIEE